MTMTMSKMSTRTPHRSRPSNSSRISLGIDPGTRRIGYGVVERKIDGSLAMKDAGILAIRSTDDIGALSETKQGIMAVIKKHRPDVVGIEKLYFAKNQKTALAVAQARGVLLLALHEANLPIREFTPNEIKLGITGYGLSDKQAVLKMVRLILGEHDLRVIDDASDALAGAIMAANNPLPEY